jgi:hypothetical protein
MRWIILVLLTSWAWAIPGPEQLAEEYDRRRTLFFREGGPHPVLDMMDELLKTEARNRGDQEMSGLLLLMVHDLNKQHPPEPLAQEKGDFLEQLLMEHYLEYPWFGEQLRWSKYGATRESCRFLENVYHRAKSPSTRAWALYELGSCLTSLDREEAVARLHDLERLHGTQIMSDGVTFGQAARSQAFIAANLQVGCVAPNIEGPDDQGQPLRLWDFRGKVVHLTFWGDW